MEEGGDTKKFEDWVLTRQDLVESKRPKDQEE